MCSLEKNSERIAATQSGPPGTTETTAVHEIKVEQEALARHRHHNRAENGPVTLAIAQRIAARAFATHNSLLEQGEVDEWIVFVEAQARPDRRDDLGANEGERAEDVHGELCRASYTAGEVAVT